MKTSLPAILLLAAAACGDDPAPSSPDAEPDVDIDAAPPEPDAEPEPEPPAEPQIVPLSAAGNDAFYNASYDDGGNLYAVGYVAPGVESTADRAFVVAKFRPDGTLDPSFGDGGVATVNVAEGGGNGELARGIAIQSTGKIVIAGAIEHDVTATGPIAGDRDIAVVRLEPDGSLDDDFGVEGILRLDLGTGVLVPGQDGNQTLAGADAAWSIVRYPDDRLLIHGATIASGDGRTDTDWAAIRLTADGLLDETFSDDGVFTLDIEQARAQARAAIVLHDGSVIASGYTNAPSIGSTQPVVYKLTAAGALDPSFGNGGIFLDTVLAAAAEAYAIAPHGDGFVTNGYGRATTGAAADWVSIRLTAAGQIDASWATSGVFTVDLAGFGDNGRGLTTLPDGRALLIGGGTPVEGNTDAMFIVLDASGQEVARRLLDLGGVSDVFWGAVRSPDGEHVALVGFKGEGMASSATDNDDAALMILGPTDLVER